MSRVVKVVGLQRSGTNYMEEILDKNFVCDNRRNPDLSICWKHAFPDESYKGSPKPLDAIKDNNVLVILIGKPLEAWIESIAKQPMDLLMVRGADVNLQVLHFKFHARWVRSIESHGIDVIWINYIDLLFSPHKTLSRLPLERKYDNLILPKKVYGSQEFDDDSLKYYAKFR